MMPVEPTQTPRESPAPAVDAPDADGGPLVIDDLDRYSRLRLDLVVAAGAAPVGGGARGRRGALGNEVLKNLALVGLGTIYVIDLDVVEPSNLSRSVLFRSEDGGRPKAEVAASAPAS